MTANFFIIVLATSVFLGVNAKAQESDDFLDTIEGKSTIKVEKTDIKTVKKEERKPLRTFTNLNDPFERLLFAQVETTKDVSYDLRVWIDHVFAGEHAQAAHLWTAIQGQIPDNLTNSVKSAYFYSLWHLNLPQTFFNQWTAEMAKESYQGSTSEAALEKSIASNIKDFENFLIDNAITLSTFQEGVISKLNDKLPLTQSLKAYALLRKGEKAEEMISSLPKYSRLRVSLAQTAALARAKKHDLIGAAKILKGEVETIENLKNPVLLAQQYINIARLLYAAGKLKNAQTYYEKIPNTMPQYLAAREEMTWTLLRLGDTARLKGELHSLSQNVLKDKFAPEVFLVRAISNLKMCYYDKVQKDLEDFSKINGEWAVKIDKAIAQTTPPVPTSKDSFSIAATQALNLVSAEKSRLEKLGKESIEATLPAVGVQKHWKDAEKELEATLNQARQKEATEYRRQWTNDRTVLSEAIRKMRFVKLEYLSQVQKLSGETFASRESSLPNSALKKDSNQMTFPVDEVLWPDELFKIRSLAQSRCLAKSGDVK